MEKRKKLAEKMSSVKCMTCNNQPHECTCGQDFILIQDNDCHWYVIPEIKKDEFEKWLEMDPDDPKSWDVPIWVEKVGGAPSLVKFSNYRIE